MSKETKTPDAGANEPDVYPDTNMLIAAKALALHRLATDDHVMASEHSAGVIFVSPDTVPIGARTGFQVFVRICRFDESLLKREPLTGGLLCNAAKR